MEETNLDFGPTETEDRLRCPTFRRFHKEWELRAEEWSPARLMGIAMGAAVNAYLSGPTLPCSLEVGLDTLRTGYIEQDKYTLDGLNTLFERTFNKVIKTTAQEILDNEIIVGTEVTIGKGRIDLVTRGKSDKKLMITDHKSALQLKSEWVPARLAEGETSWQLRDYAWRASQFYGEPVEWTRTHLIIFSPTAKSFLQPYPVSQEALRQWRQSAEWWWADMQLADELAFHELPQNLRECIGRYGKCPAYAACHTLYRDERAMEAIYKRRK